jgi:hypothetical protein
MSSTDGYQRIKCSVCGNRYRGYGVGILLHELRGGRGSWLWHYRFLCPPCRVAHIDLVLAEGVEPSRRRKP